MTQQLFQIPLLLLALLLAVTPPCHTREEGEFEPVDGLCDRCVCIVRNQSTIQQHDYSLLDCSTKNLQHMLVAWPDVFDGQLTASSEIVFSLSGNNINALQQLPATDADLVFSCRHCNLSELSSGIFLDAPNVIRLDLSWNRLTGDVLRPDVFRGRYAEQEYESIALDELDLSYNVIEYLDESLFEHMAHLRKLSLAHNPIEEISEGTAIAIGSITRLEYLDLSYTELEDIPGRVFQKIDNLRELLIQGNRFTAVPGSVALLKPTLISLYIGENPIQLLNDESFFDLEKLTHLNISGMPRLEEIDIGTFSGLKSLEVLICNHNPELSAFDLSDLKGLVRLRELDLSNNALQHLHLDEPIPKHDDSSDIAHIEVFPKLRTVQLDDNPWHCDCELHESVQSLRNILDEEEDFESEARCETPNDLTALPLTELDGKSLCLAPPKKVPKIPIYEAPPFLRPRSIVLSILSVGVVLLIGFIIGLVIVCIKRRLKESDLGFTSPVRYSTVRNSTTSNILQQA
ncbi:carboxypeptidase N subunit 2 isoform X2 [Topomyia yanbarensis]|uniref:carboxypeptidase N subunit 2 isoform X2 n=1 Tax=Topomyia yanbarensis TaxID=2498891 RepID=UPI00273CD187|nr:carboxypeptidase N subunit 2 isoform X2 [Topomyia yanbarensis]